MFADDTVLLFHARTWNVVKEAAEQGLSKATVWLENSLLSLNTAKTKYLCFCKTKASRPDNEFSIKLHTCPCNRSYKTTGLCSCSNLSRENIIKYLGITIDEGLKWGPHISNTAKRVRKLIFAFKSLRTVADNKLLMQTYNALCLCVINYCITSWGGASKTYLIELERAQRSVLKVMSYLPFRYPTTLLYEKLNVLTVRKQFIYACLRKYHCSSVPVLPPNHKRKDRCPIPTIKSELARRHYSFQAPSLYNKMNRDCNTKNLSNYQIKDKIKKWLAEFDYDGAEKLFETIK